jgi:hypothetical protein
MESNILSSKASGRIQQWNSNSSKEMPKPPISGKVLRKSEYSNFCSFEKFKSRNIPNTVGPRYMREIGTPKIDWHIMNLHIKKPRMTDN